MDAPWLRSIQRDPFLDLSKAGGGDHGWKIVAAVSVVSAFVFVFLPGLAGVHASLPSDVFRLRALGGLAWAFVAVPTGFWIYFWLPDSLSGLVPEMRARGLLVDPSDEPVLDAHADDMIRRMNDGRWPVVGIVAAALVTAILVIVPDRVPMPGWLKAVQLVATAPLVFAATVLICRLVSGTAGTVKLLQQAKSRVIPLHADGAGGWSPFGHRAAVLGRAAAVYGLVALIVNIGLIQAQGDPLTSPASLATMVALLALPPFVIWAWLFAPHRAMLSARERAMQPIALTFEKVRLDGIPESATSEREATSGQSGTTAADAGGALKSTSDWLDELKRRREQLADAYPAWPLRLVELRALWATALLPVITAVVGAVSDLAAGWVSGD